MRKQKCSAPLVVIAAAATIVLCPRISISIQHVLGFSPPAPNLFLLSRNVHNMRHTHMPAHVGVSMSRRHDQQVVGDININRRVNGCGVFMTTRMKSKADQSSDTTRDNEDEKIFEPLGVGVKRDFGRRLPLYKSDITDGLNAQSLATILFLFFACLAPAIGFGGILDAATSGAMGTIEMLVSTAACGVAYAIFSAQPMQLIGPMGPLVAFSVSLAQLARHFSLPYLPLYAWTGLWTSGMLFVASATSASNVVKKLTRFTDEIFSVLISTIFLVEAITKIAAAFTDPAVGSTQALLSLLCASLTFGTATILKGLNGGVYFTKSLRKNLSNFAPAIGVLCGSLAARAARLKYGASAAALPALSLPAKFATTSGRPWLIPLGDLPVWARWGAALPAALGALLLFLDQNITARLVNNPRNKQIKGRDEGNVIDGMHGDMLVLSLTTGLSSIIGLPWMGGATTRSAAHVRSLLRLGEDGTTIVGSIENRVSGAAIHALIGACVLFPGPRALLTQVPLPVLSGVFLYLGMTSLQGLELWDRVRGLFKDPTVAPKTRWSGVRKRVTSLFTGVQMACVSFLMVASKSSLGVIAPLIIALLPALRAGLVKSGLVGKKDMDVLDADAS